MTLSDNILRFLNDKQLPIPPQWVREMKEAHPAFILPGALLVKRNPEALSEEELGELKLYLLLNSSDPVALADFADIAGEDWAHLYPRQSADPAPSTDTAISTFLDAYGSASESETAMLEQLIFNPVAADYFAEEELDAAPADGSLLPPELRKEASPRSTSTDVSPLPNGEDVTDVTNSATSAHEIHRDATEAPERTADIEQKITPKTDDSLLSESLAKIFIKQHRYERAFEIISNLSLNFPEKSVYFADQLRFLQKLIKNQEYQQQNK